jgi:hypothetical protein
MRVLGKTFISTLRTLFSVRITIIWEWILIRVMSLRAKMLSLNMIKLRSQADFG